MTIEFSIAGVPVPQGSKNAWGGEDNPHTKSWREAVANAARALDVAMPFLGPVSVRVDFIFPRPKAHYRTGQYADWLRDDAPTWVAKTPDLDKLCRAIGDALSGVLVRDDSQIVHWDVRKRFGAPARADVVLRALANGDEL